MEAEAGAGRAKAPTAEKVERAVWRQAASTAARVYVRDVAWVASLLELAAEGRTAPP